MEIPSFLIHKIQVGLRKQAGVPSYDPADQSLPPLPSLHDALAKLLDDPSSVPSYLRCSKCHRQLLRGIRSTLCVFCGREQQTREGFSHSISFTSTAAYRNLLYSLGLDGSEAINFETELNDSTKSRDKPNSGLVLSSLLDLELRWQSEKEETVYSNIDKAPVSTQGVNLSGVDLNTFFSDSRNETTSRAPSVSSEHLMPKGQVVNIESSVSPGFQDFHLFEGLQSSNLEVSSTKIAEDHADDSFANWEAEFQSASSDTFPSESKSTSHIQDTFTAESASSVTTSSTFAAEYKSLDLFHGPSSTESVNHARLAPTLNQDTEKENETCNRINSGEHTTERGQFSPSVQMVPNDPWAPSVDTKNTGETHSSKVKNEKQILTPIVNSWGQEFPTDIINESDDTRNKKDDNDDVFEDSSESWNDFTSSMGASHVLTDSRLQTVPGSMSYEHASTTNSVDIRDMEFGSFKHSNTTSGALFDLEGSTEVNSMNQTASASSSHIEELKNTKDVEDDESDLGIWQGFTSSNEPPVNMSNLSNQSGTEASSNDNISTEFATSKKMDVASTVLSDFSGAWGLQEDSSEVSEVFVSASCRNEFHITKHIDDKYDSLEALQKFTNSSEEPRKMSNVVNKTGTEVSSNEHISGTTFIDPEDMDFGSFVHSDSTKALGCQKGSDEVNEVSASASSINEFHDTKDINDDDDPFESWQDFTGSRETLGGSSFSWTTGPETISIEPTSLITPVEPLDMEFGSFFQSHSFSEVGGHKGSNKPNTTEIDALLPASITEGCNSTETMKDNADPFDAWQLLTSSNKSPGRRQTGTEFISNEAAGGQKASIEKNDNPLDALVSMSSTKDYINTKNMNDYADPFEAWQGILSSHDSMGGFLNLLTQTGSPSAVYDHASVLKSVGQQGTEYSRSSRSEYSGPLDRQKGSIEVNDGQFDSSISRNRMNETDEETVVSSTIQVVANSDDYTNASILETSNYKIEKLLSDMPDLSFMLDSNLSIPKKVDGSYLNS